MRAFISRIVDGCTRLGTEYQSVSNEYGSIRNLVRYGVLPRLKVGESAQVEVFFNWDNRYGNADKTFTIQRTGESNAHYKVV